MGAGVEAAGRGVRVRSDAGGTRQVLLVWLHSESVEVLGRKATGSDFPSFFQKGPSSCCIENQCEKVKDIATEQ